MQNSSRLSVGPKKLIRLLHRRVLLVACIFLITARPAIACLNDTSVTSAEDEFRSSYRDAPSVAAPRQVINPWGLAAGGVGGGMALGSLIVMIGRKQREGKSSDVTGAKP